MTRLGSRLLNNTLVFIILLTINMHIYSLVVQYGHYEYSRVVVRLVVVYYAYASTLLIIIEPTPD